MSVAALTRKFKRNLARRSDVALHLMQHASLVVGLIFFLGAINVFAKSPPAQPQSLPAPLAPELRVLPAAASAAAPAATVESLSSPLQRALSWVAKRYRVSPDALRPIFEVAQVVGRERQIDPLLIVAIIGVESGFNPFAESVKGARGLMQVIPRFHLDKVPEGAGESALLDPLINVRVGVHVLEEAIRRQGGLEAGLQYYSGALDGEPVYANRVLAEKEKLEQAGRVKASESA